MNILKFQKIVYNSLISKLPKAIITDILYEYIEYFTETVHIGDYKVALSRKYILFSVTKGYLLFITVVDHVIKLHSWNIETEECLTLKLPDLELHNIVRIHNNLVHTITFNVMNYRGIDFKVYDMKSNLIAEKNFNVNLPYPPSPHLTSVNNNYIFLGSFSCPYIYIINKTDYKVNKLVIANSIQHVACNDKFLFINTESKILLYDMKFSKSGELSSLPNVFNILVSESELYVVYYNSIIFIYDTESLNLLRQFDNMDHATHIMTLYNDVFFDQTIMTAETNRIRVWKKRILVKE